LLGRDELRIRARAVEAVAGVPREDVDVVVPRVLVAGRFVVLAHRGAVAGPHMTDGDRAPPRLYALITMLRRVKTDRRPEAFAAGEIETQLRFLEYLRDSVSRKLDGLSEADVRRRLVPTRTTLLWLAKHVAAAETLWLQHIFTAEVERDELPDEDELDDETIASVQALLAATGRRTREIVLASADPDQVSARDTRHHSRVTLRWILAHLVEEVARHAGHADILRELTEGATGR